MSSPTKTRLNVRSVLWAPFLLQARPMVAKRAFLVSTLTNPRPPVAYAARPAITKTQRALLNASSVCPASLKVPLDHFHAVTVMSACTLTKKEALRVTSALLQETTGRVTTQLVVLRSVHSAQRSITGTDKIACHVTTKLWIAVKQG